MKPGTKVEHPLRGFGVVINRYANGLNEVLFGDDNREYIHDNEVTICTPPFNIGDTVVFTHVNTKPCGITKHCTGEHTKVTIVKHDVTNDGVNLYKAKFPDGTEWWVHEGELKLKPMFDVGDTVVLNRDKSVHIVTDVIVNGCNSVIYILSGSNRGWFDYNLTKYDDHDRKLMELRKKFEEVRDIFDSVKCGGVLCDECPFYIDGEHMCWDV